MIDHRSLEPSVPAPLKITERIDTLDLLRGVAVLGILIMNIQSFSMPESAYFNPTSYGDLTGINMTVWMASHLLVDLKFMAIFSMLFGAGIVLLCQRLEQSGIDPARIYYRRILLLFGFGILHAYLFWSGDILVWYSESALIAFFFRRVRLGWLIFWALLLLVVGTGINVVSQLSMPYWPEDVLRDSEAWWNPSKEFVNNILETYRSGWSIQLVDRSISSLFAHTAIYAAYGFWRILGMMLAGMVLMKWGILSGDLSRKFYVSIILSGFAVGFPVIIYGSWQNFSHHWSMYYSLCVGSLFNYWGSLPIALAYISLVVLWSKSQLWNRLQNILKSVGRMAFSGYIIQTLICTTLFYGHGFGLYGKIPRWGQLLVVMGVWIVVVAFAEFWMKRFRYGPIEWLWRSLTYGTRQPMKLSLSEESV